MEKLTLSLLVRPLGLIALLVVVAFVSSLIRRAIPDGRVKRFLTIPVPIIPRTEAERRNWWPVVAWVAAALIIWVPLILWAGH